MQIIAGHISFILTASVLWNVFLHFNLWSQCDNTFQKRVNSSVGNKIVSNGDTIEFSLFILSICLYDFRCERYFFLPANCQMVEPKQNNCCHTLNCSKHQEECKDNNVMCEEFGSEICTGDYKRFGMEFCHKTCGICK